MTKTRGSGAEIAQALQDAGAEAAWHVIDLGSGTEIGERSDDPVVTASTYKTAVLLEVARQAAAGELSLTDRVKVPADRRTMGPTGLSVMLDDLDISVRDLAFWMMCVSDNTATDVLQGLVGTDRVNKTLADLGLGNTFLEGDCNHLLTTLVEDAGGIEWINPDLTPEKIATLRTLNAPQTNRTTPREAATLLRLIWTDEAGPAEACAEARRIMALQVWPHRLSSAFGDGIKVSGKTGTLIGIRNEIGVVEYPDGGRYAAAVFVTTKDLRWHKPEADAVIGKVARLAIDELRGE
ncbi:MAG TPA: serine hydrolase [Acidimicrobiales bacterium]|nr:serine hydrolase [Acidimicrobiales bacterium]